MININDKQKAEAFDNLCTQLYYARIVGSNQRIRTILNLVDDYCRASQGEYSQEEKNERIVKSCKALIKI